MWEQEVTRRAQKLDAEVIMAEERVRAAEEREREIEARRQKRKMEDEAKYEQEQQRRAKEEKERKRSYGLAKVEELYLLKTLKLISV
ncbi:hypothetical protein HDU99_000735, partial [Rhizoclosmatium hyalinum]